MKKHICLLLISAMLFLNFSLPVYAVDSEEDIEDTTNIKEDIFNKALTYTCVYDTDSKRVKVSGTMNNDIFADYSDWMLCVYSIPAGKSEYDVIESPDAVSLAEAMVSIKFEFTFRTDSVTDRYSRYALFLRSPDDEFILTTEAQYPEVSATYEFSSDKHHYKGLQREFSSFSTEVDAGTSVVPVDINLLFSDTSTSTFFFVDEKQYFFNDGEVEKLDIAVRSMSASGSKIYLRLLYPQDTADREGTNSASAKYLLPDLYDQTNIVKIHALASFLAQRYNGGSFGEIDGMILGKGWDTPDIYNYSNSSSLEEYADKCGIYTVVVANAARTLNADLDIVIPLTADGFVKDCGVEEENNYCKSFVEELLRNFDNRFYAGINCSFLIDVTETPMNITELGSKDTVDLSFENPDGLFYAGAHQNFSEYILTLRNEYRSAPNGYMFIWSPETSLRGNSLTAAYIYSYYALLMDSSVSAFVVDLSGEDANPNSQDILHIMKYVDTYEGLTLTNSLLAIFGKESWADVFGVSEVPSTVQKHCYSAARVEDKSMFMGEFTYFDFSQSSIIENWYQGSRCMSVKVDYTDAMKKVLRADFDTSGIYNAGELLYISEYSENMIHTPYLKLRFHINGASDSALYEIKLVVGNGENSIESACIAKSKEVTEMFTDISKYVEMNMVDYIRISVRCIDGTDGAYSLCLYDLCGLSATYDSDELDTLISSERDKIRHQENEEEDIQHWAQIAIAIGVILIMGAIGAGLFISFRRDDTRGENKDFEDGD